MGEVEFHARLLFDVGIGVELGAIVGGDGFKGQLALFDEMKNSSVGLLCGSGFQFADEHIARLAFDEGHDAVFITPAHDGIDLPVALGAA